MCIVVLVLPLAHDRPCDVMLKQLALATLLDLSILLLLWCVMDPTLPAYFNPLSPWCVMDPTLPAYFNPLSPGGARGWQDQQQGEQQASLVPAVGGGGAGRSTATSCGAGRSPATSCPARKCCSCTAGARSSHWRFCLESRLESGGNCTFPDFARMEHLAYMGAAEPSGVCP